MTLEELHKALVGSRVVDPDAISNPEEYDDCVMLMRIDALYDRLQKIGQEPTRSQNRNEIITNMCYTWRHDFGLDRQDDNPLSSGMTKDERSMLYLRMQQVFNNCIEPHMEFKNK